MPIAFPLCAVRNKVGRHAVHSNEASKLRRTPICRAPHGNNPNFYVAASGIARTPVHGLAQEAQRVRFVTWYGPYKASPL